MHAAPLTAYDGRDTVMMPLKAADHAYLSFEQTALPVAIQRGVGVQAMKVFGSAHLLRSLNPTECLGYVLNQPGAHVAICGAGTQGQMEDNIRAVRDHRRMTPGRDRGRPSESCRRRRGAQRTHNGVLDKKPA